MSPGVSLTTWDMLWLLGGLFVGPFLAPLLTSFVVGWVLQIGYSARLWGLLFAVATIPLSWVFLQLGGWPSWSIALLIGSTLTALFLWWRSRVRPNTPELNRGNSDDIST